VAHAARVYDYLLGGRANFKVDREVAAVTYAAWPGGIDAVRADVREHRAALGRVVRYFVRDAGITQFLDIGTGIPKENNVHEVAQAEEAGARIVYVDRDPIVLAHAHQLLRGTRQGSISYIYGDLHDPPRRPRPWTSPGRPRSCCSESCTSSATRTTRTA
jgi:hypothetical protein